MLLDHLPNIVLQKADARTLQKISLLQRSLLKVMLKFYVYICCKSWSENEKRGIFNQIYVTYTTKIVSTMDQILLIGVMTLRLLKKHTPITEGTDIFKCAHNGDKKCVKHKKKQTNSKSNYAKGLVFILTICNTLINYLISTAQEFYK